MEDIQVPLVYEGYTTSSSHGGYGVFVMEDYVGVDMPVPLPSAGNRSDDVFIMEDDVGVDIPVPLPAVGSRPEPGTSVSVISAAENQSDPRPSAPVISSGDGGEQGEGGGGGDRMARGVLQVPRGDGGRYLRARGVRQVSPPPLLPSSQAEGSLENVVDIPDLEPLHAGDTRSVSGPLVKYIEMKKNFLEYVDNTIEDIKFLLDKDCLDATKTLTLEEFPSRRPITTVGDGRSNCLSLPFELIRAADKPNHYYLNLRSFPGDGAQNLMDAAAQYFTHLQQAPEGGMQ